MVWGDNRTVSDSDIVLRRSDDGGLTWGPEVRVDSTGDGVPDREAGVGGLAASQQWHPSIAVRGDDVLVAWQDFRRGRNEVFLARSRDGGRHFDSDHVVAAAAELEHRYFPTLAVASTGTVYVVWQADGGAAGDGGDLWLARSDDLGETFTQPVRVDDAAGSFSVQSRPALAVSSDGRRVAVAWRDSRRGGNEVRLAVSEDGGDSFAASLAGRVAAAGSVPTQGPPQLAMSAAGSLVLAWHELDPGGVDQVAVTAVP